MQHVLNRISSEWLWNLLHAFVFFSKKSFAPSQECKLPLLKEVRVMAYLHCRILELNPCMDSVTNMGTIMIKGTGSGLDSKSESVQC